MYSGFGGCVHFLYYDNERSTGLVPSGVLWLSVECLVQSDDFFTELDYTCVSGGGLKILHLFAEIWLESCACLEVCELFEIWYLPMRDNNIYITLFCLLI